jgi:uncharacterized membrane protein YqgA involved in biofilm formation
VVPGTGTALNAATVLAGSALGVLLGARLPRRVSDTVTDGLGLLTLLVAGLQASRVSALAPALGRTVVLMVLGAILLGGLAGSLLRVEERLESLGEAVRRRTGAAEGGFVDGFVLASLVFCVGPLTILGALQDGLHGDIELLAIKSALDGFAALAFASALGWGVAASVVVVVGYQGALTAAAAATGERLSAAVVDSVTAVGGLLLVAVALRLLRLREIPVGDLLPALAVAPVLTVAIQALR